MNLYHIVKNRIDRFIACYCLIPIGLAITTSDTFAHGWTEYPVARQTLCHSQGGFWNGVPPDPACAQANDISGSYPFVQKNEFANLIPDYHNRSAVLSAVPDGTLCYANDPQKRGMASSTIPWQKTEMSTGQFQLIFNATAPHNPSFWEIYLTKPSADLLRPLEWAI